MKKLFIVLLCMMSTTAFCQDDSKTAPIKCEDYEHLYIEIHPENLRLHRPRRDCEKGFGICCKPACITLSCGVVDYLKYAKTQEFANGKVAFAIYLNDKLELHFPISFKQNPEYEEEDFRTFYIDEPVSVTIKDVKMTVPEGEYSIKEEETQLIVILDLK